jgi:hypothetical protein
VSIALGIEDIDRADLLEKSKPMVEAEKQCRIVLSSDWKKSEVDFKRVVELSWNPGTSNGRTSIIALRPGKAVVQPLFRAMTWFGPFGLIAEFQAETNDARKQYLREKYASEKMRILNQYDYPRPVSMAKFGVEPIGPHRFPDVTVTVIDADGSDRAPMRLHAIYKIGEFDEIYPLDSFGQRETVDEVKARYEAELEEQAGAFQKQFDEMRRQMSEMAGMVKGLAVSVQSGAKSGGP